MSARLTGFLWLLSVLALGCGGNSETGSVAVVDLDRVMEETGVNLEITNAIQTREAQIREGLEKFQAELDEKWAEKKKEFGEEPNDEQTAELQAFMNQLQMQNQQARNQANQNITMLQQQLLGGFQQQMSPICLEVAQAEGYALVVGKNPTILAYDTSVDITDLVIEKLKAARASATGADGEPGTMPAMGTMPGMPTAPGMPSVPITPSLKPETEAKPEDAPAQPEAAAPEENKEGTENDSTPAPAATDKPQPETTEPAPAEPGKTEPAAADPPPESPAEPQ